MQRGEYEKERVTKDASKLKVGIVVSAFNEDITEPMLEGAKATLAEWGVKNENVEVVRVPGSFEIPYGCLSLIKKRKPNAIIAIGCVIKGETDHDRYIASAAADGIMSLTLTHNVPISFGVITTNTLEQAKVRSVGTTNKGREAALAALEMALIG